jgi:dsDNA-specific endonuclease/ATPase MutS2
MVSTVDERYLTRAENAEARTAIPSGVYYAPMEDISPQISVIGMTSDEAILEVERFLDRAAISSLNIVYILHGKGTGALRRAIKQYLSTNEHVADFRLGYVNEGSSGVTVVTLKKD